MCPQVLRCCRVGTATRRRTVTMLISAAPPTLQQAQQGQVTTGSNITCSSNCLPPEAPHAVHSRTHPHSSLHTDHTPQRRQLHAAPHPNQPTPLLRPAHTTQAVYDHSHQQITIFTPKDSAQKYWIGGAAQWAQICTVFAQLHVRGECHGPHVFAVRLRDSSGRLLPGVQIQVGPAGQRVLMRAREWWWVLSVVCGGGC